MDLHTKMIHTVGIIFYSLGALIITILGAMVVWANFEASLFDVSIAAEEPLGTLRCSLLLSDTGSSTITTSLSNPTERPLRRRVTVSITDGFITLIRKVDETVILPPGETSHLTWLVDSSNVVWDRFVLARVYVNRTYPMPSSTGACGIVYIGLTGVTGDQLTGLLVVASLLGLGGGLWLWSRPMQPSAAHARRRIYIPTMLTGLLALEGAALFFRWWLVAGTLLVLGGLLLVVLLSRSLAEP